MSDFMNRASLAGAVDLSSLRRPEPAAAAQGAGAQATEQPAVAATVNDLVVEGNDSNLKQFLTLSNSVPVVIDFYSEAIESSKTLSAKLKELIRAQGGRILLVCIDVIAHTQIAQAFQVSSPATVVALLKGQPVPLFIGDQTNEALITVFDRMLQIAGENGLNGTVTVDETAELPEPQAPSLPPRHEAAYQAIDQGNYLEAVAQYEAQLAESPADSLAKTGLAQAKLLVRTDGIDFESVLASTPSNLEETLLRADAFVAVGHAAEGYSTILTRFATADNAEREVLRKRLIELFEVSQPDAPEVAAARRTLASMLY